MLAFHLRYLVDRVVAKSPFYSLPHGDAERGTLGAYDFESAVIPFQGCVMSGANVARVKEYDICRTSKYAETARRHFANLEGDFVLFADSELANVEYGLALLGMDIHDVHVVSVAEMREWHAWLQRGSIAAVILCANVWGPSGLLFFVGWALLVVFGTAPPEKADVLAFYTQMWGYKNAVAVGKWQVEDGTVHVDVPDGGLFRCSDKVEEVNDLLNL